MFTSVEKNVIIAMLEVILESVTGFVGDASTAGTLTKLVTDLRTAFDADPATATAEDIVAALDLVAGYSIPSTSSLSAVIAEARAEAA